MPVVICQAVHCAHNLGGRVCNAAEIKINEDTSYGSEKTDCGTFIPRDFSGTLLSLENVNYGGMVAQAFSGMHYANPDVSCSVQECIYHDGRCCDADEIHILEHRALTSLETRCGTFSN